MRSCSREYLPCQNSTDFGITKYPPQCSGLGICSPSGHFFSKSEKLFSNSALEESSLDCALAQAPICEPRA